MNRAADLSGVELFEKQIRPLLAEHCYQCHGRKKQESGLALHTLATLRKGGDRGPAIVPGDASHSLIVTAVEYASDDLKMPPRGKLADEQIAVIVQWVKQGAPGPDSEQPLAEVVAPANEFNLAQRREHWAYQPVARPAAPAVAPEPWPSSPIDSFIVSRLKNAGLAPSPAALQRTLLRRVTFDLTGLPPTPEEVIAFLGDRSPDAYEKLVDRLLASPRYGERWARHWLDVVRYSETLGFEFDYDLHHAWRYRDYVIRAFNGDLPYDQFVVEHLAGDLVPEPRRRPLDGCNESILATGFWWMLEGKQTPVDIRQDQTDRIDNQLDVLGKAFLGQTIACARCHDHKFDAISTRDYYALSGYLRSSRFQQAFIDPPDARRALRAQLAELRAAIERRARAELNAAWQQLGRQAGRYLLAASLVKPGDETLLAAVARDSDLPVDRLQQWVTVLAGESLSGIDHPLYLWRAITRTQPQSAAALASNLQAQTIELERLSADAVRSAQSARIFERFEHGLGEWFITGDAYASKAAANGQMIVGARTQRPIARITTGGADSGLLSPRLQGELRSRTFTIDKKFAHLKLAGQSARVNLVIDGYTLIMNPMYGKLTAAPASNVLTWWTMPVDRWVGRRAYFEISDSTIPMHGLNPPPSTARVPHGADGYVVVDQILLSDDPAPPLAPNHIHAKVMEAIKDLDGAAGAGVPAAPSLAAAYERAIADALDEFLSHPLAESPQSQDCIGLINWLLENGLLDGQGKLEARTEDARTQDVGSLAALVARYHELEAQLPPPQRAPALADGTGENEFVLLRGNWRTPGEPAPRGVPQVFAAMPTSTPSEGDAMAAAGSGRLDLARKLVDRSNPLLPRVLVNRLWQHHFGAGLVRTPDDFGRMGQPPSHPELLDHLASELIDSGWSLKALQRRMVTASVYRQGSQSSSEFKVQGSKLTDAAASGGSTVKLEPGTWNSRPRTDVDPENRLLHHMPARRLEAEAVRDSLLAISGNLRHAMYGPSVLPFVTPYMEGRGKPQSGPLDGDGRRSIYLNARRNFLTPLLLAFDYPVTFTPIGRRGTSAIPAQALTLMNDPFVVAEAGRWAERSREEASSEYEQRIAWLYETAFARPPTTEEVRAAVGFLQAQSLRHGGSSDDPRVWTDLCHVLMNVKEFIFVE